MIESPLPFTSPVSKRVSYVSPTLGKGRRALGDITNDNTVTPFSPTTKSILKSPKPVTTSTPNINSRDTPARRLKVQLLSSQASSLIHWNNKARSGLVVLAGTCIYYLMHFSEYYPVAIFCYLASVHLLGKGAVGFLSAQIRKFSKKNKETASSNENLELIRGVHRGKLHDLVDAAVDGLNYLGSRYNRLGNGASYHEMVAVIAAFVITAKVSHFISFDTIIFAGFIGLFTIPKYYAGHKDEVDQVLTMVEQRMSILAARAKVEAIKGAKFAVDKAIEYVAAAKHSSPFSPKPKYITCRTTKATVTEIHAEGTAEDVEDKPKEE